MIGKIQKYIVDNWQKLGRQELLPDDFYFIQISNSRGKKFEKGRVVYLIFLPKQEKPILSVKICRDESYAYHLKKEFNNLDNYHKAFGKLVPKPLVLDMINDKLVMIEDTAPGIAMDIALKNLIFSQDFSENKLVKTAKRDFGIAKDIIEKLNSKKGKSNQHTFVNELKNELRIYYKNFNIENIIKNNIYNSIKELCDSVNGHIFQRVVHFDFIPRNIFIEKNKYQVIDWEFSDNSTLLFLEPTRFTFYYWKLLYDQGKLGNQSNAWQSFAETALDDKHWFGQIVFDFFGNSLLIDQNVTKEMIYPFFLLHFIFDSNLQCSVAQRLPDPVKKDLMTWITFFSKSNNKEKFIINVIKEENKRLKTENRNLKRELKLIRKSPSWKLASFLHKLRINTPFINNLKK